MTIKNKNGYMGILILSSVVFILLGAYSVLGQDEGTTTTANAAFDNAIETASAGAELNIPKEQLGDFVEYAGKKDDGYQILQGVSDSDLKTGLRNKPSALQNSNVLASFNDRLSKDTEWLNGAGNEDMRTEWMKNYKIVDNTKGITRAHVDSFNPSTGKLAVSRGGVGGIGTGKSVTIPLNNLADPNNRNLGVSFEDGGIVKLDNGVAVSNGEITGFSSKSPETSDAGIERGITGNNLEVEISNAPLTKLGDKFIITSTGGQITDNAANKVYDISKGGTTEITREFTPAITASPAGEKTTIKIISGSIKATDTNWINSNEFYAEGSGTLSFTKRGNTETGLVDINVNADNFIFKGYNTDGDTSGELILNKGKRAKFLNFGENEYLGSHNLEQDFNGVFLNVQTDTGVLNDKDNFGLYCKGDISGITYKAVPVDGEFEMDVQEVKSGQLTWVGLNGEKVSIDKTGPAGIANIRKFCHSFDGDGNTGEINKLSISYLSSDGTTSTKNYELGNWRMKKGLALSTWLPRSAVIMSTTTGDNTTSGTRMFIGDIPSSEVKSRVNNNPSKKKTGTPVAMERADLTAASKVALVRGLETARDKYQEETALNINRNNFDSITFTNMIQMIGQLFGTDKDKKAEECKRQFAGNQEAIDKCKSKLTS